MKHVFSIGVAGMCGAILRTSIGMWVGEGDTFPIATFSINLVATWLLCFLATGVFHHVLKSAQLREAINVGFLGSFSTFSTFSMETVLLVESGQMLIAVLYVVMSLVGGIGIGYFGFYCGRKWKAS